jgi:hypothetical protein
LARQAGDARDVGLLEDIEIDDQRRRVQHRPVWPVNGTETASFMMISQVAVASKPAPAKLESIWA